MTQQTSPPALPRRLAAMLYDTFLVLPIIMATVAASMALRDFALGDSAGMATTMLNAWLVRLIALITVIVFFCSFWLKSGQTLGMQAWRIQLVSFSGGRLSARQALLRCLGAAVSALCLGAGFWWCLFDSKGRYWHDHWSKSELLLSPKQKDSAGPTQ